MKKWMYVIFPGVMLGLFLVVYLSHVKEAEAREEHARQVAAKKIEDEKLQKKEAEERAKIDADKRQKEREEEDRKKEAERKAKQDAADKEIRDSIAAARAEADASTKKINELEIELDRLHKQREQLSREDFELAKAVEAARVAKRRAEMQQQHLTMMLSQRASASPMARPPLPPAPAKQ